MSAGQQEIMQEAQTRSPMAEFPDWEDKNEPPCCSEGDLL